LGELVPTNAALREERFSEAEVIRIEGEVVQSEQIAQEGSASIRLDVLHVSLAQFDAVQSSVGFDELEHATGAVAM
jgi:hypothetical protein